jgi:DNA-binding MurR/RpiR family transcriptional regulator
MDFEERVISQSINFTDLEDKIVNYFYIHREQITDIKISYVAQKFYTYPNTITRLCHKLGYTGFADLKSSIRNENTNILKINDNTGSELQKNLELISQMDSERVIERLLNAKKINFYSMGQTAYATRLIVGNFYALDFKSVFYDYPNDLTHIIGHEHNDVFFLISLSGKKRQLIKLANEIKSHGNCLITLTHLSINPLAKIADERLFCYSPDKRIDDYNVTDKFPILLVMNDLFKKYAQKMHKKIKDV